MAIRSDSYSTVAEVAALTRHLLDGNETYGDTTRPTLTEVEKFIDRSSGVLNIAFRAAGFAPSAIAANSTAKLTADDWVTIRAAELAEMTQRGAGFSDDPNTRLGDMGAMLQDAHAFVAGLEPGLKEEGITTGKPLYEGLTFTGFDDYDQRSDPDDTSLEQPRFRRRQWDNT